MIAGEVGLVHDVGGRVGRFSGGVFLLQGGDGPGFWELLIDLGAGLVWSSLGLELGWEDVLWRTEEMFPLDVVA